MPTGRDNLKEPVTTSSHSPQELLPVSMLSNIIYCKRLFYLQWVQKERMDSEHASENTYITRKSLPENKLAESSESINLSDDTLKLTGIIQFIRNQNGETIPFECKTKSHMEDDNHRESQVVRLVAKALLLEAHGFIVPYAQLLSAYTTDKTQIKIDESAINQTLTVRDEAFNIATKGVMPPPLIDSPKCDLCALSSICLPDEHALLLHGQTQDRLKEVRARGVDNYPLHITGAGSVVKKDGQELIIEPREGETHRMPIKDVSNMQLHGSIKVTNNALISLLRQGSRISYFSSGGWFYGRTNGPYHKNIELRLAQFKHATSPKLAIQIAQRIVRGKIWNTRVLLRRYDRNNRELLNTLQAILETIDLAEDLPTLLGIEGQAAALYFRAYAKIITEKSPLGFSFKQRNRRPPKDPINAMLSYGYALLTAAHTEVVERVGFDPYLGFYHQPRYGRPALALDMMEEFRSIIVDSIVLNLVRRQTIKEKDFIYKDSACAFTPESKKRFIHAFEQRLETKITHPTFGYTIQYRQVFEVQARLLGRYLMNEIPDFPEFKAR